MMTRSCIVNQLEEFARLDDREKALLAELEKSSHQYAAGEILQMAGQKKAPLFSLNAGWACSIRLLPDGERQVLDVFLPGQVMGLHEIGFNCAQSEMVALTDIEACPFPRERLRTVFRQSTRLAQLFFLVLARERALLTERIVNLGRRPAGERLSHFIIELKIRTQSHQDDFELPLTQSVIGDALGMSTVHVSRTISRLKQLKLISTRNRRVRIENLPGLIDYCGFDHAYLEPAPLWIEPAFYRRPLPEERSKRRAAACHEKDHG